VRGLNRTIVLFTKEHNIKRAGFQSVKSGRKWRFCAASGTAEMIKETVAHITCACGTGTGKTFRLKVVFLAGKIIRTASYVLMKLPEKSPLEKCMKVKFRYLLCCDHQKLDFL
jgi:hypothetical protein